MDKLNKLQVLFESTCVELEMSMRNNRDSEIKEVIKDYLLNQGVVKATSWNRQWSGELVTPLDKFIPSQFEGEDCSLEFELPTFESFIENIVLDKIQFEIKGWDKV